MSAAQIIGVVALLIAVVQIAAMGFIGYPIARRRPGGMAAFRRSGFTWWLGILVAVSVVALIVNPDTRSVWYPSSHGDSVTRFLVGAGVGLVIMVLIELGGERVMFGERDSESRIAANAKYEGALPIWARGGTTQLGLLALVALLEEFIFRNVALGSLWYEWELPKAVAAGLVTVAFGFAHWYYGFRQIALKLVVGSVLTWAALTGGWLAAAVAHMAGNICLTLISQHRASRPPQDSGP